MTAKTPLDRARDNFHQAKMKLINHMRRNLKKSDASDRMINYMEKEFDQWIRLNPNFTVATLEKDEAFGGLIKWGKFSPDGQKDPIPIEFYRQFTALKNAEREVMESWKS